MYSVQSAHGDGGDMTRRNCLPVCACAAHPFFLAPAGSVTSSGCLSELVGFGGNTGGGKVETS
jgi:hypothetical protein